MQVISLDPQAKLGEKRLCRKPNHRAAGVLFIKMPPLPPFGNASSETTGLLPLQSLVQNPLPCGCPKLCERVFYIILETCGVVPALLGTSRRAFYCQFYVKETSALAYLTCAFLGFTKSKAHCPFVPGMS